MLNAVKHLIRFFAPLRMTEKSFRMTGRYLCEGLTLAISRGFHPRAVQGLDPAKKE